PAANARVEAVERADGRAAGHLPGELVDAAVARADEALRRLDVADRAAQVHAAGGDGDELVVLVLDRAVDLLVVLADVDGRLADLAHVALDRQDLGAVGVVDEIVGAPDVLPSGLLALEDRAEREAQRGQDDRRRRDAAGDLDAARHEAPA